MGNANAANAGDRKDLPVAVSNQTTFTNQ